MDESETVMVGDELDLDIRLPKRLGMKAILLDRVGQSFSKQSRLEAHSIVRNLTEAIKCSDGIMIVGASCPALRC